MNEDPEIERNETITENEEQNMEPRQPFYPEGWRPATRSLWNGAIFTSILILLCAVMIFFFPKGDLGGFESMNVGLGTLLVYFLIMAFTAMGAINTYQKGLTTFASLFAKDGARALDIIRWGFMCAFVGVLLHMFIFCLPIIDHETKQLASTLLVGNSILIIATLLGIVGFLMLGTAEGCPNPSRKGALLMIVAKLVLLGGAFLSPSAMRGETAIRLLELIILLIGSILFLVSWKKIIKVREA